MSSRRSLLNYIGIFILMIGMGAGEFIYWRSLHGASETGEDPLLWQHDSAAYQREVQTYVGTLGFTLSQWAQTAAEPKALGIEIAVASMLAAGGCFILASRMPRD